jgi:hypothetical protein
MASNYSPLKIELITTGEQSGTWGTTTNINLGTALEEAITGSADVTFASANVTLTLVNTNNTQAARNLRLRLTGTTGGARNLIVPPIEKQYIVQNDCADVVTIKNSTGTGVAVPPTMSAVVFNDGVNVSSAAVYSTSVVTPTLAATDAVFINALPVTSGGTGVTTATGTGAVVRAVSPTLTTPALGTPTSGTLTSCTGLPMTTGVTGTLPVLNGGTGVTTSTGTGNVVLSNSPTLVTPILGTPTSGTLTNCTGLPMTTGVTGTLPVLNGGTGVTTSTGSGANALATSPTLVTPILGTPTSGTLTNCTGLPIASGVSGLGTGVSTFLATPTSANLASAVTDETGSGSLVFATSPSLVTPNLGTPASGTLTNCTGLPVSTGVSGLGTGVATALGVAVGSAGAPVVNGGDLGTPSSGVLTNCTGTAAGLTAGLVADGVYTTDFTGSNQSIAASGYQKLPGGLIMQWGITASISVDSSLAVTYSIAFPTAALNVNITAIRSRFNTGEGELSVSTVSTTGFTLNNGLDSSKPFYWMAIGY